MELYDAPTPFRPKGAANIRKTAGLRTPLCIDIVSLDQGLVAQIKSSLHLLSACLRSIPKTDDADGRVEPGHVDLTIVHLEHADDWPSIALKLFQDGSKIHPTVILCERTDEARSLRNVSDHIMDVLPTAAVRDYRFRFAIEGALLRGELLASLEPWDDVQATG